jgi:hypothetical protein
MIKNEKQYKVTKQKLNEFVNFYEETSKDDKIELLLKEVQLNALIYSN